MLEGVLKDVQEKALQVWKDNDLLEVHVDVKARTLSVEEAIGNPEGDDFPLQKGKERLMEAKVNGARGQAFTDLFGDYSGTLGQVANMELSNNFRRAVFVSVLNAVQASLGQCKGCVHCKDQMPSICAGKLVEYIKDKYGAPKIAHVGFQPAMVEKMSNTFEMRVLDLDPDNIGKTLRGAYIHGPDDTADCVDWADLLVVTGSTISNDTIGRFLTGKPVIFFGTTISGAATLMGWERYCLMEVEGND